MPLYTRTGDAGATGLLGGGRVAKDDPRIEVCGAIDELNSVLGLARAVDCAETLDAQLAMVQSHLFALAAEIADPGRDIASWTACAGAIATLEQWIDAWEADLPPLRRFILPGGSPGGAALHVARAVARRAERALVGLSHKGPVRPELLSYLNRLSDYLFIAARSANAAAGAADVEWQSGPTSTSTTQ